MGSEVFNATSTPSPWLSQVAESYGVPLYVNEGESGIGQDWNFAYSHARAPFVTIAHQDDVYCPEYAARAVDALAADPASLIFFTDYGELRQGERVDDNELLRVKRRLLAPLKRRSNASRRWAKRAALRFGSAICCPSVTFNVANCPNPPFVVGMKSNLDWATWEALSRLEGSFLYEADHVLMYHRIHSESATSELIASRERDVEDLAMLERVRAAYLESFRCYKRVERHVLCLERGGTVSVLPEYPAEACCKNALAYVAACTGEHHRAESFHTFKLLIGHKTCKGNINWQVCKMIILFEVSISFYFRHELVESMLSFTYFCSNS